MKTSVNMDYFHIEISTRDLRKAKKEQPNLSQSIVLVLVILIIKLLVKNVKQFHYIPGKALSVPGE
jgi:hypothetical protein